MLGLEYLTALISAEIDDYKRFKYIADGLYAITNNMSLTSQFNGTETQTEPQDNRTGEEIKQDVLNDINKILGGGA